MYVFFHQVELITTQAMKAGFTGGLVVDYPNSTRAKKWVAINTVCQATHVLHTVNYERTDLFIETSMPILFSPGQPKPIFNKVIVVACDSSFVVSFHFFFFFRIFLCLYAGVVVDKLPKVGFLFCGYITIPSWFVYVVFNAIFTFAEAPWKQSRFLRTQLIKVKVLKYSEQADGEKFVADE